MAKQKIEAASRKGKRRTMDFKKRKGENFIKKTQEGIKVIVIESI